MPYPSDGAPFIPKDRFRAFLSGYRWDCRLGFRSDLPDSLTRSFAPAGTPTAPADPRTARCRAGPCARPRPRPRSPIPGHRGTPSRSGQAPGSARDRRCSRWRAAGRRHRARRFRSGRSGADSFAEAVPRPSPAVDPGAGPPGGLAQLAGVDAGKADVHPVDPHVVAVADGRHALVDRDRALGLGRVGDQKPSDAGGQRDEQGGHDPRHGSASLLSNPNRVRFRWAVPSWPVPPSGGPIRPRIGLGCPVRRSGHLPA